MAPDDSIIGRQGHNNLVTIVLCHAVRAESRWVKQLGGMVSSGLISLGRYPDSPPVGR